VAQRAVAVLTTAHEWGHAASRLGVAPTPGVARLAAQRGSRELTLLIEDGTATAFLRPLGLGAVGLDAATADRLALVGLRTLGDVAALPRGALGDHLGPGGPALEALARGEDDRPLVPTHPPLVLTARRELDWALDDRAQLTRLCWPFSSSGAIFWQSGHSSARIQPRMDQTASTVHATTARYQLVPRSRSVLLPLTKSK